MRHALIAAAALAALLGSAQAAEPAAAASMPVEQAVAQANAATQVALAWLGQIDADQIAASREAAAAAFKAAVTEAQWQQAVASVRGPLGKLRSRAPLSAKPMHATPPGMPEGDYITLQFKSLYQNKPEVVEQVTLVQEGGAWRVIGYFVK